MALKVLITAIDTNDTAKSFGIVGSVLLNESDIKKTNRFSAANDDAVSYQKDELNSKKLVAIIDQLSIMDNLFKQRLSNQKLSYENSKLDTQEDRIERQSKFEQIKDAERVQSTSAGSGLGMLGLLGIGLLAYDPVMKFITGMVDFASEAATFVSDTITEITNFFEGFLPDALTGEDTPTEPVSPVAAPPAQPKQGDQPAPPAQPKPDAQPAPPPAQSKPAAQQAPAPAQSKPAAAQPAPAPAKPAVTPPAKESQKQPAVKDDRSWWERNAPTWAGGKPDPNAPAKPAEDKPKTTGESYVKPVDVPINSKYGWRKRHPVTGKTSFHHGVDMAAPKGTPVKATKSGKVILANNGNWHGYGKTVAIQHADGYNSIYGHLSKILCKVGDQVKQGQIIGEVGSTGVSTGNHLHFMLQKGALQAPSTKGAGYGTVDPTPLLTGSAAAIPASSEPMEEEPGQSSQSMPERLTKAATEAADNTLTNIAEFIGTIGGKITGPGMARSLTTAAPDFAQLISSEAATQTAEIAKIKEDASKPTPPPVAAPPNISAAGSSVVENLPTMVDRNSVQYYISRFGYKETNAPIKAA